MARIKCNINEDSTLIKFEAVQHGEVFVADCKPFVKWSDTSAFSLMRGDILTFKDDTLVTYVKKAELKLTI